MNGHILLNDPLNHNPFDDEETLTVSGVASMGHVVEPGAIDISHGTILYLEDVTVSFDGFRALNKLSLVIDVGELR